MKKSILFGMMTLLLVGGLAGIVSANEVLHVLDPGIYAPPIDCNDVPFVVTGTESAGVIKTVTFGIDATLTQFCPPSGTYSGVFSAMGFRTGERVLYAVNCSASPLELVKIGGDCVVKHAGDLAGTGISGCLWSGDIDSNGKYWYLHKGASGSNTIYKIDLDTGVIVPITVSTGNLADKNIYDWAYFNGKLYGGMTALGSLAEVNIEAVSPGVTVYSVGMDTGYNFAAAWFDTSDNLINLYRVNGPAKIYKINDTFKIVSTYNAPTIANADGAYCPVLIVTTPEFPTIALPLITIVGLLLTIVAIRRMR